MHSQHLVQITLYSLRQVVSTGKSIKKGTNEDAANLARNLNVHHDRIAGASSFKEMAAQVATSSAGQEGIDALLSNVKDLVLPDTMPATKEENDEDMEEDEEQEEAAQGKNKRKKGSWFDRDREVNKAHKLLQKDRNKSKGAAAKLVTDWEAVLKDVSSLPPEAACQLDGEQRIARTRITCLQALLQPEEKLQEHLASYGQEAPQRSSASVVTAEVAKQLGNAPPCQSYLKLRSFEFWETELNKVMECTDQDGVEAIKLECNGIRDTVGELLGASRSALSDVSRGIKAAKTAIAQRAAKKQAQRQNMQTPGRLFSLADRCTQVPVAQEAVLEGEDLDRPLLIKLLAGEEDKVGKSPVVMQFMHSEFKEQFANQNPSHRLDRAFKKLPAGEVKVFVSGRATAIFPLCKLPDNTPPDIMAKFETMAVIVGKNTVKCTPEKSFTGLCVCCELAFPE